MLALTRKEKQTIVIGDEIEISVVAIQGQRVRLGVKAPDSVPIQRIEKSRRCDRDSGRLIDNCDLNDVRAGTTAKS